MKKVLFLFALIFLCFSCFNSKYDVQTTEKKEWVYMEILTTMKKDTSTNYVYGQVKKSIIDKIRNDESAKGLFFVENLRYFNDDDLFQVYEDKNDKGILVYRIENIQKIEFYKKDPILVYKKEQLHESALKVLKQYAQK